MLEAITNHLNVENPPTEHQTLIIALFGESGSGKDTIKNFLVKNFPDKMAGIVRTTSRPPRQNEDVNAYRFVDKEVFENILLDEHLLVEAVCFNNWFYGTEKEILSKEKINVGCYDQESVACLLRDPNLLVLPIKIEVDDKIRLQRCLNREDNPNCKEICRRFLADKEDYEEILFEYATYKNEKKLSKRKWKSFIKIIEYYFESIRIL